MNNQKNLDFKRICEAIGYIRENFRSQPDLDLVAKAIHLSPYHFHRIFSEWVGISPKKFTQYLTISYAKNLLKNEGLNLFETLDKTGLSSTSRLHDLFISIEGMTPSTYRNGGKNLTINYSFSNTPFGEVIIASTDKGICYTAFQEHQAHSIAQLQLQFPNAHLKNQIDNIQQNALSIFNDDWTNLPSIKLHLKGTPFQLQVWQSLLKIPQGKLSTYGQIAANLNRKNASRAVGNAIGSNPVAFLIPCHRVIQSNGTYGGYKWGSNLKSAIIGWEASKNENTY
jgi:AraC family transcriptional regulator of adaptative response/methylated-DNA-[protein]-cysteine methyltransferase